MLRVVIAGCLVDVIERVVVAVRVVVVVRVVVAVLVVVAVRVMVLCGGGRCAGGCAPVLVNVAVRIVAGGDRWVCG